MKIVQSENETRNIVQHCRVAAPHLNIERISFFAEILPAKIIKFLKRFSALEHGEKKLAFIDSSAWGSGKQGALVTDKGVYTVYGKENIFSKWKDIDSVYLSNSVVCINDRDAFLCGLKEDETRLFYHMIYDIFRSIRGKKIKVPISANMELPQNCVGCPNSNINKQLKVPVYGEEKLTGKGKLAQSYSLGSALMGSIVLSVLAASVAISSKRRDKILEFSIPFCDSCFSKLSTNEKDFNSSPLVITKDIPRSFYGNRYFSLEIENEFIEFWFKNEEYANNFISGRSAK